MSIIKNNIKMDYNNKLLVERHLRKFFALHDYCIKEGITRFGYGSLQFSEKTNPIDHNSPYMIFMTVIGYLQRQYGADAISYVDDMIFFG